MLEIVGGVVECVERPATLAALSRLSLKVLKQFRITLPQGFHGDFWISEWASHSSLYARLSASTSGSREN